MKTLENRDGWTADKDALLRRLWDEGLTGSQIAQQMRTTRNAILARARRIRCAFRVSVESKGISRPRKKLNATTFNFASGRQSREPLAPLPRDAPACRETIIAGAPLRSFDDLEAFDRTCRYPHGDAPPYQFCALPSVMGTSWCLHHLKAISPQHKARIEAEVFTDTSKNPEPESTGKSHVLEGVA